MKASFVLGLVLVFVCLQPSTQYRWAGITVDSSSWYEMPNLDFSIIGEYSMVFAILGCKGADIILYEKVDDGGYVLLRFGDNDNQYSLMFANTHCDETAGCTPGAYDMGAHLDCTDYKVFWARWDNIGGIEVGYDNIIGENVFMAMNYNLLDDNGLFTLRYVKVTANVVGEFITFQFLIDHTPDITSPDPDGKSVYTLSEDTPSGSYLLSFTGEDAENDTLLWGVIDENTAMFLVNYTGDTLDTNTTFDYETQTYYSVRMGALDGMNVREASFNLEITDADDNAPVVTAGTGLSMAEEYPVDHVLGGLYTLTDPDTFRDFTYAITGTDEQYFKVDADGNVMVKSRVDRDALGVATLTFTFTVTDSASQTGTDDITVTLEDINDNTPSCTNSVHQIQVEELSASAKVIDLVCTDSDDGDHAVVATAISTNAASAFSTSGFEVHADGSLLDYEDAGISRFRHYVTVDVYDTPATGPTLTGHVMVVAEITGSNEADPVWSSPTPTAGSFPDVDIDEDSTPGVVVVTFDATDADLGLDSELEYEITTIETDDGTTATGDFIIDPENGELRVGKTLDADTGILHYDIDVTVKDKGTPQKSATATQKVIINNVNDQSPVFNSPTYEVTVDENIAAGADVLDLDVTDPDGDTVTFTLTGSNLDFFEITGTKIVRKNALDFETTQCYTVGITASDGVHETKSRLTVNVNNINDEAPVISTSTYNTLREETPLNTIIHGYYTISDPDGIDTFTYSLTGGGTTYLSVTTDGDLEVISRMDRETMASVTLDLSLQVTDSAGNSATESFTITVTDINDNIPTCTQSVYVVEVEEAGVETEKVLHGPISCSDDDDGNNAQYTLSVVTGGDTLFRFDGTELIGPPDQMDYETKKAYNLEVEIVDTPDSGTPNTGVVVVLVQVTGTNEFTPAFTSPVLTTGSFPDETRAEDLVSGTVIVTFVASDGDDGKDGDITFEIVSITSDTAVSSPDMFKIGEKSGELFLAGTLDADTGGASHYDVVVKAVDNGDTPLEVQGTQRILLTGVNDNPPTFTTVDYDLTVNEDAAVNDVVFTLVTDDVDGDTVTLTAVAGDTTEFGVTGHDIVVLQALDFETRTCYSLDISASDGVNAIQITVTIKVNDVNDVAPTLSISGSAEMMEELPLGTLLYGFFTVSDPDIGDSFTYSHAGTDSAFFTMNADGALVLAQRVDLETLGGTTLTIDVTVTDAAAQTDTQTLTITVLDMNDNTPSCDQVIYTLDLTEASGADAKLMDAITCTDADTGDNAAIALSVVSGDDAGIFRYETLELWGAADNIDYEALAATGYQFYLSVAVVDQPAVGPKNTGHILVVVTITGANDNTPVWAVTPDGSGYLSGVTVGEDSPVGSSLTTLDITDADHGSDGDFTYQLVSITDDGGSVVTDMMWVNPDTGVLYVGAELDADTVDYYDVVLKGVDTGAQEIQATLQITLTPANDNPPVFDDTEFVATVAENAAVGDVVHTLAVSDVDGDTVTLSVEGAWSGTFGGDGLNIVTKAALDYETKSCYSVLVRASDGVHTTDRLMTMEVSDVDDEPPVLTTYTISIPEELPDGVIIGDVFTVTDPDTVNSFTYTLGGSDSGYFAVDSATGHLSIAANIDRDAGLASITGLTLTVEDPSGNSDTANIQVDVTDINDRTPYFSEPLYSATVTENVASVKLTTLTCNDDDNGPNGDVTISIPAGEDPTGIFSLTGDDLYADGTLVDLETTSSYTINVICVDSPTSGTAKTGATVVQIEVLGENEADPTWNSPVPDGTGSFTGSTISESDPAGTVIETFTAADTDSGPDGEITLGIVSTTSAEGNAVTGLFFMVPDSGELQTARPLDADTDTGGSSYYDVIVKASDGGSPVRSVTGTIRVSLTDANDNGPKFTSQLFTASVTCDDVVNDVITTLATTDADSSAGTVTYSIPAGSTEFSVDPASGELKLQILPETLDDTELRQFVVVKAEDAGDATRTDMATVAVTFAYCGAPTTTTSTTTTTTTTTTTQSPVCEANIDTEVIVLAAVCAVMAVGITAGIIMNAKSLLRRPPARMSSEKSFFNEDAFERPLEDSKMDFDHDSHILEDHPNQIVFESMPPSTTVGGNFFGGHFEPRP